MTVTAAEIGSVITTWLVDPSTSASNTRSDRRHGFEAISTFCSYASDLGRDVPCATPGPATRRPAGRSTNPAVVVAVAGSRSKNRTGANGPLTGALAVAPVCTVRVAGAARLRPSSRRISVSSGTADWRNSSAASGWIATPSPSPAGRRLTMPGTSALPASQLSRRPTWSRSTSSGSAAGSPAAWLGPHVSSGRSMSTSQNRTEMLA